MGGKVIHSKNLAGAAGLKSLVHDLQRNCLFIASGDGKIFVLNALTTEPELLNVVETGQKAVLRGLSRSFNLHSDWVSRVPQKQCTTNLLVASDVNGVITICDIGEPGMERLTKKIGQMNGRPK